jgi:hypothetical protein
MHGLERKGKDHRHPGGIGFRTQKQKAARLKVRTCAGPYRIGPAQAGLISLGADDGGGGDGGGLDGGDDDGGDDGGGGAFCDDDGDDDDDDDDTTTSRDGGDGDDDGRDGGGGGGRKRASRWGYGDSGDPPRQPLRLRLAKQRQRLEWDRATRRMTAPSAAGSHSSAPERLEQC